ncbi:PstS family phosphate ABC transporter substrate-binding protein [Nitrospira lenta]|uniref:Phosphate-binding protein n=1 Tax=Nitrospira lenta TaxID=1436998 RepID=A0A330L5Q4_9BACT|nr:PstS family phosphate ABC transporter substrate-binding protein [Nitrospira lenta]SPP65104.1 Protein SphX [Nitrospira lenta]
MQRLVPVGLSAILLCAAMSVMGWPVETVYPEPTTLIKVDGSSTVFPITEAVAEEFQKDTRGSVRVTVGISGTGGGFKKFCRGEIDVQDASRPISSSEMDACRAGGVQFYELPIAFDALTIAVSPLATWVDSITVAELKTMWEPSAQGRVTKWSQVRSTWPDQPLKLFGAGSDSGTFDYFTEAVVGKAKSSRGDFTASEDDNTLVQGIANDKQALGYIPFAYYEPNKKRLKAVSVDGGHGPVSPSRETVENGSYQPLSRPLFIYVSTKSAARPEVKRFVEFYLAQVPVLAPQVKYVPLPPKAYALAGEHFKNGRQGTAFQGGSTVGMKIEELLRREATL